MQLTFLGATGTVTGSKYLIATDAKRVLVDCGLFQGLKQLRLRNWEKLPIDPKEIDAVILTHAHIDHSGYLPLLSKKGFSGKVYCSTATRDLCEILLPDAGHLQEEEAEYANRKGFSKHSAALPLYTQEDAERCLKLLAPFELERDIDLGDGISLRFSHSGHIVGSCFVRLTHQGKSIVFTGDLGRSNDIVMKPPVHVVKADYLVLESTYGDRLHGVQNPETQMADIINRTVKNRGVVVIPTFAVGRAQELLYYIHLLKASHAIPDVPVYLNSPMAADATRIFHNHPGEHRLTPQQCEDMCHTAKIVNSVEESKQLNNKSGPMIILAASGMATGGRVVHHLKAFAPDPKNTILFAGFQAAGTRGATILSGADSVKIHGQYVPVRAEVQILSNVSAHADYAEILEWLDHFEAGPRQTYVTHGEPVAADALRHRIEERKGWRCEVPDYRELVDLN
ncbi:MAG: MBL fold metallo-hydrolase [Betaproteobacteria bacterium]|nr:MBL fold metallo-hydrolase [Betaproteobacteria bacterium]